MAEISEAELTIIENALVTVRQAIEEDQSPAAMEVKKQILEAEQVISGKLDQGGNTGTGPGADTTTPPEQQMAGTAALLPEFPRRTRPIGNWG